MTIAAQMKLIRDTLAAAVRPDGGTVFVAGDPYQLVTMLRETTKGVRVGVLFSSEEKRGDYEERGAVDREFWVIASRGQGLKLEPGASLVDGAAGGRPLFDIMETLRQAIRGISFDAETTEVTPDFRGIKTFNTEGYLVDAYQLTFTIGSQLVAIEEPAAEEEPAE